MRFCHRDSPKTLMTSFKDGSYVHTLAAVIQVLPSTRDLGMSYWLLFLLLTGSSFGFDSPQHQIRQSLGQLSEPAHGGAESLPSFHATSIEPDLSSLSPPTLPQSGLSTHNPSPTHRNSNEPGTVGLRTIVSERPKAEEHIRRPSIEGTSICVGDKPRGQNWIGCAVCMEEFDITALKDEKLVPSQAPLRQLVACHHTYHKECIDTWLRDPRNTCPHCRTPSTDDDIIRVKPSPDFASTVIQERYTGPLATRPSESPCFGATVAIFVILIWAAVVFEMIRASHYNHPSYHP
ncbi:hypothetical protein KEM48_011791 [Puccinia striiformis f. sp. tritici PST-130]|uniref:RING-type domain-containing protein n=1 Tax=Puccinia striiformis f. sp. tritici PST-78 TaxID=1165861 RepID=A0A0L0VEV3_9BASI|nr:hypothetical protein KEM48_011791 [Puccinia striiformis f. sp. tritici PST-130]KNE97842.1 hypothetical protein PSTG_08865 [Puccinia striiformis f. sp. tritici PST-78]